jgi:formylglycine-generating enzyme
MDSETRQGPGCNLALDDLLVREGRHEAGPLAQLKWQPTVCGIDGCGLWASLGVGASIVLLRWVTPGTFAMGVDSADRPSDGPSHQVTLTQGFWLAETPCTQDLWTEVMGHNPSLFRSSTRPVEAVAWDDTQHFFDSLSQRALGFVGRLPTEAEWEYACGADGSPGSDLNEEAWYAANSFVDWDLPTMRAGTRPVGLKKPNRWGLFDMLGNVEEWCLDGPRQYTGARERDPLGPCDGEYRVFRGGDWLTDAGDTSSTRRYSAHRRTAGSNIGFRVCYSSHDPCHP